MSRRLSFLEAPFSFKLLCVAKFIGGGKKYAQQSLKKQTKSSSVYKQIHTHTLNI